MSDRTDPEPRRPWGRRPLPAGADWRRALDVYVAGKSSPITFDEKRGIAEASPGGYAARSSRDAPRAGGEARRDGDGDAGSESMTPRFGVPVPEVLAYHRNAGTWRNHLSVGRSRNDTRRKG